MRSELKADEDQRCDYPKCRSDLTDLEDVLERHGHTYVRSRNDALICARRTLACDAATSDGKGDSATRYGHESIQTHRFDSVRALADLRPAKSFVESPDVAMFAKC